MKRYHATWTHDRPDDPVWMAYEVTEDGKVPRMVEHFALGWTDRREAAREDCESLLDGAFDPTEFEADPTTALREITAQEFEALWQGLETGPLAD